MYPYNQIHACFRRISLTFCYLHPQNYVLRARYYPHSGHFGHFRCKMRFQIHPEDFGQIVTETGEQAAEVADCDCSSLSLWSWRRNVLCYLNAWHGG